MPGHPTSMAVTRCEGDPRELGIAQGESAESEDLRGSAGLVAVGGLPAGSALVDALSAFSTSG